MFIRGITSLYGPTLPAALASQWRARRYSGIRLISWFWRTDTYDAAGPLDSSGRGLAVLLSIGMLAQIVAGLGFLIEWARYGTVGAWEFGAALLLGYPLVWAHLLAAGTWLYRLVLAVLHPKKAGRGVVCGVLEHQVVRLRKRHQFKVVAVAGSVGKTSTKLAIADLLAGSLRVRHQMGNYNDRVTVPLVFFGLAEPNILNVFAWLRIFGSNRRAIRRPYPYDVVVVELGTDAPGAIADFTYLHPDVTVVTAISAEHMEFFKTLDAVAAEELAVFEYSKRVLINGDDIAGVYVAGREFVEYSLTSKQAQYHGIPKANGLAGQTLAITLPKAKLQAGIRYVGLQGAKFALAAAAVADMVGVTKADIARGLPRLQPFTGRMQVLPGSKDSTLIDDTYNASPLAVCAALDVLYAAKTSQRIAILGSMNELGEYSQEAHTEVGAYCDAKKLSEVVTIGNAAREWLAPAAQKAGCNVVSFKSPYEAGDYVKSKLKKGAVVLAKGSQNGVFAEEALRPLLADPKDTAKLVRQSPYWLAQKSEQFNR